jgi:hypothetical protein
MEHLLHPWHYVEFLTALPFVGMLAVSLRNRTRPWWDTLWRTHEEEQADN